MKPLPVQAHQLVICFGTVAAPSSLDFERRAAVFRPMMLFGNFRDLECNHTV